MPDYYYRYDYIGDLRKQAHDPTLRARRIRSQEHLPHKHHQLATALSRAGDGEALFRISMWKDQASAAKYARHQCDSARNNGIDVPVLQRVRQDHPFFARYQRDDDEHLADFAWLFWRTETDCPPHAGWSRDCIPHDDIEVLQLDGSWVPFKDAGRFGVSPCEGFDPITLPHGTFLGDPGPILWAKEATAAGSSGERWIVVISPPPTSTSPRFHAGNDGMLLQLAEALYAQYPALEAGAYVLVALEASGDSPWIQRLPVKVSRPARRSFWDWLTRKPKDPTRVHTHHLVPVKPLVISDVLAGAGATEIEKGDKRWVYKDELLHEIEGASPAHV